MKIKCFFNKHKWIHGRETRVLLTVSNAPWMNVLDDVDIRYCPICHKKERRYEDMIGSDVWQDTPLSKEEIRDKKLKQLIG